MTAALLLLFAAGFAVFPWWELTRGPLWSGGSVPRAFATIGLMCASMVSFSAAIYSVTI